MLHKGVFIPKLPKNPLASWCFIRFYFLLSHTAHFDGSIILILATFQFLLSVFFLNFKRYDNIVL